MTQIETWTMFRPSLVVLSSITPLQSPSPDVVVEVCVVMLAGVLATC
jgi:hypothetical protein